MMCNLYGDNGALNQFTVTQRDMIHVAMNDESMNSIN